MYPFITFAIDVGQESQKFTKIVMKLTILKKKKTQRAKKNFAVETLSNNVKLAILKENPES